MVKFAIGGVIGAILTPFLEHGDPDFGLLHAEVAALDRAGIDAVCVGGAVGEMAGSTPEEFGNVCSAAAMATSKPVLAAIYPDSTVEGVQLAERAITAGAAALLVAQPHYLFQPDAYGLEQMFETLRRNIRVPVILSNSVPSAPLDMPRLERLVAAGLIDGIHQAGDAHVLADLLAVPKRLPVLSGLEDLMYPAVLLGAEGVVSGLAAVFPTDCAALYAAVRRKDHRQARAINEMLVRIWRTLDHPDELIARLKFASGVLGRPVGVARSPYDDLSAAAQDEIVRALEAEGRLPPRTPDRPLHAMASATGTPRSG